MNTNRQSIAALMAALIAAPALAAQQPMLDYPQCRDDLQNGIDAGLITQMGLESKTVVVVVEDSFWNNADYATKLGVAAVASCAITGGADDTVANVRVRSNMTNHVLGEGTPYNFKIK